VTQHGFIVTVRTCMRTRAGALLDLSVPVRLGMYGIYAVLRSGYLGGRLLVFLAVLVVLEAVGGCGALWRLEGGPRPGVTRCGRRTGGWLRLFCLGDGADAGG